MTEGPLQTAIVVPIELPEELERIRGRETDQPARGIPAHVTLLVPFVPHEEIDGPMRAVVAEIIATMPSFEVELGEARRFPPGEADPAGVLWLAPRPAGPFVRLTRRLVEAFPAYPPYGGTHDDVIPHLTMATLDAERFDVVEAAISVQLPVRRLVDEAVLLVEDASGRWAPAERYPLG